MIRYTVDGPYVVEETVALAADLLELARFPGDILNGHAQRLASRVNKEVAEQGLIPRMLPQIRITYVQLVDHAPFIEPAGDDEEPLRCCHEQPLDDCHDPDQHTDGAP